MEEKWKPVTGFEKYEVSSLGNVRSIDREVYNRGSNRSYKVSGKLLKPKPNKNTGRMYVSLYSSEGLHTNRMISRMVAEGFIPNPNNLEEVNHIDRDVTNNSVTNLEWVSPKDNMKHLEDNFNFTFGRVSVTGTNIETGEVHNFSSLKNACEYLTKVRGKKTHASGISNVINGVSKSSYGYYWKVV